jgi:Pro-kumamolisin, activation domain/Bacterial Ig-like domain (group 3)
MRAFPAPSYAQRIRVSGWRTVVILLASVGSCGAGFAQQQRTSTITHPLITQAIDETQLTRLTGNTHRLARAEFDLGTAPATLPMERMLLVLKRSPEQEAALEKLMDAQQDKNSPNYHQWLTPEQFGQQFGPADTDMQILTGWLQSHGFQVGSTKGRTVLEFSGSASQVQEAFHTTIHKYIVNGEQHWANASDPSIPTALAPAVAGIDSLHNFLKKATNVYVGQYSALTKHLRSAKPEYTYNCGNSVCYAVTPYDFATIYDVQSLWNSGINGAGQTIAIVGRTDIYASDATNFWQLFGLTVPANKLNIIYNGIYSGITGDEPEADIDVQWSGSVAPQATIDYVDSATTETTDGVDLSAVYIVENNLAPVMSESYGECELGMGTAGNQFYSALWQQAAAQGISVFVSSGDNGSAGCDDPNGPAQYGLNVNGIASTPFNAAVGGTDFNQYKTWSTYWNSTNNSTTQQSAKGYIPETTWNDSCTNSLAITLGFGSTAEQACNNSQMIADGGVIANGGSGGPSNCAVNTQGVLGSCTQGYAKPSWQSGAGVPNDNLRDLPDVSLFASNGFLGSFYVICQQDQTGGCNLDDLLGYGGTSVASPAFAGIMSLVNQKTGIPQGIPGFALYKLVSKQPNAFHDTPSGSTIAMPCLTGSPNCVTNSAGDLYGVLSGYNTGTAYDLATGLGSVDVTNLVDNWTKATFTATSSTLQLNSGNAVNVTHGTAVPVSIGVSPTAAMGEASLLVSTGTGTTSGQAIDGFKLSGGSTAAGTTTSRLPAGTYSVIAHYGGDTNYGGSYSSPVTVTVSKENSSVMLGGVILTGTTTAVTTFPYDAQYFVRADVGNSQGAKCSPVGLGEVACPTGNVIFTVDGQQTNLNNFSLNSEGSTETAVGALPPITGGTHALGAQYSGDTNYNASTGSITITVTKAATQTTQVTAQGAITQPVALATNIEDPTAYPGLTTTPTGTVTFYSNGTAIPGTPAYSMGSNGSIFFTTATLNATFSAPGTYALTASYSGDQNYQPSASTASQVTLQYPQPAVSASPATQNVLPGTPVTVTALVDANNKIQTPTGTITLGNSNVGTLAGPTTCTKTTDSSGNYACQATFTFTPPPPSVASVDFFQALYSGDTNYPASQSGAYWIYIADFSLGLASSQITVAQGSSQTAAINISAINGFTGAVSNFGCSGLPAETSCSFNPTTVSGGTGSTTLTVTTTPLGQSRKRALDEGGRVWSDATGWLLIAGCLMANAASRRRRLPLMFVMLTIIVALPSCGGSSGVSVNNPTPSISSLSPAQMAAGSIGQTLTINGSGFVPSSTVTYNGTAHVSTFVAATQISLALNSSDVANTGSYPIAVTNPAPGGGTSSAVNFSVVTGTPAGTFPVTVTATSGSLTNSTTFNLVVQ